MGKVGKKNDADMHVSYFIFFKFPQLRGGGSSPPTSDQGASGVYTIEPWSKCSIGKVGECFFSPLCDWVCNIINICFLFKK